MQDAFKRYVALPALLVIVYFVCAIPVAFAIAEGKQPSGEIGVLLVVFAAFSVVAYLTRPNTLRGPTP